MVRRKRSNPNQFTQRRRVYKRLPYLLPTCPLEYARGIYQGEGSCFCGIDEKAKRASLETDIVMEDKDALTPLQPCFGNPIQPATYKGKRYYRLRRRGQPALKIAQTLATTPTRKKQIQDAIKRCQNKWQQGYSDQLQI